jgi:hypothetical protein
VADPCNAVYRVDNGTLVPTRNHYGCPVGVAYDAKMDEFVADGCNSRIYEYAAGSSTADILVRNAPIENAGTILVKWGHIFLACDHCDKVMEYNKDGSNPVTLLAAGVAGLPSNFQPVGLAAVGDKLAVSDYNSTTIYLCSSQCASVDTIPAKTITEETQNLGVDAKGQLIEASGAKVFKFVDSSWKRIVDLTASGDVVRTIATTGSNLYVLSENCDSGSLQITKSDLHGADTSTLYSQATLSC